MRKILVLLFALSLVILPTKASAAERFRSDSSTYNGSNSALGIYMNGNSRLYTMFDIRAVVQLPARYASHGNRRGFCAYARLGVNGVFKRQSYADCDTNGDATLMFRFHGPLYASAGDHISVWFADPVTRYVRSHPDVKL
jgi:hypothetical protein